MEKTWRLMMTEFVTIKEANESHKGNIRGVIIKTSDLKAGTGKGGDWTMKNFTMEDATGQVDITCWDTEIGRLEVGNYYEIDSPWWKERNDKPGTWNLGLGQYCKITKLDNPSVQKKIPESAPPTKELPKLDATRQGTIHENTILISQIEREVTETLTTIHGEAPRGDKVGMYTRMNFYYLKGMSGKD